MESKGPLTNEKVRKKFTSLFDLVNYAIKLAENMIKSGRDTRVKTDSQNRALQVLSEIAQDKDQFDEIPSTEEIDGAPLQRSDRGNLSEEGRLSAKGQERKRVRKSLAD